MVIVFTLNAINVNFCKDRKMRELIYRLSVLQGLSYENIGTQANPVIWQNSEGPYFTSELPLWVMSILTTPQKDEQNAYSGLSREVWLLSGISLVNRAGSMVFPFMTIYLTQSMNFSYKEAGIIMSFFGAGSIAGAYLGGWLTDRIGDYQVQFWSLIATSIVALFILKMATFWEMAFIAFLFSTVADAFRPANKVAISNYSKPENITRSYALLRLAINLGFAIGPAAGGLLAAWKGYDWLFYVDALTCLAAAIIFRITMKDDFSIKKSAKSTTQAKEIDANITSPYQDKQFLFFLLIIGLMAFAFLQFFYTLPVFYKQELGLDEGQIGLFMALNGVIIVLFEMPLVFIAEKKFKAFNVMAFGAFLIAIGFLCFLVPLKWVGIAALAITFMTLGEIFYMPFASAWVATRSNSANRGQYMAAYSIAWSVASVVAPAAGFQMIESLNFNGLWIVLFSLSIVGAIAFGYLGKKIRAISIA